MSTLTSLLVRDQIVSIRTIEEAIQRQVISGGDLPSVLLEMGAIAENTLVSYLAAQYGLAPAGREEVMSIPEAILKNVPPELAIEKRILPIGETAGRLLIACARPLRGDERRELGFAIGHAIELRITLDLRIAAGLHRHYGETLSRREQRLLRKIDAAAPGELREVAPLDPNRVFNREDEERESSEERPLAPTRFSHEGKASQRAESPSAEPGRIERGGSEPPSIAPRAAGKASNPALRTLAAQPIEPLSAPRPTSSLIERHRGPLTAKRAVEMLGRAESRDEILAIAMGFIRQFFDYTALFVVHDDEAEGLDAYGSGPDYRAIQKLSVRLDPANAFGKTREERLPRIAQLGREESEREFISKARRADAQPSLIAPIAIEHRVILMLYADREGEELTISDIPEVIGFLPRIGEALKQLILKRKRQTMRSDGVAPKAPERADHSVRPPAANVSNAPSAQGSAQAEEPKSRDESIQSGARRRPRFAVPLELPKAPPRERSRTMELLGIAREEPDLPDFETLLQSRQETARPSSRPTADTASRELEARKSAPELPAVKRTPDVAPSQKARQKTQAPRLEPPPLRQPAQPLSEERARTSEKSQTRPPPIRRARVSDRPMPRVHKGGEERVEVIDTSAITRTPGSPRSIPPLPRREKEREGPRPSPSSTGASVVLGRIGSPNPSIPAAAPVPAVTPAVAPAVAPEAQSEEKLPPAQNEPSSIVVEDDGTVEAKVEALVTMKPSEASELIRELVAAGSERALTPLIRAFPGELYFLRSVGPLPRPAEISSVARAIAAFGAEAGGAIAKLLKNPSADIRYYALAVAKETMTPAVAGALAAMIRDEDRELRRQALELLRALDLSDPSRQQAAFALVQEASDQSAESEHRLLALSALGALGAIEVADGMALLLDDDDPAIVAAARAALVSTFADDMGPSRAAWQTLIESSAERHRIDYLIEGLLNEDEAIRRDAGAELQRLSREYLGYHAGLPRREREVLKRRYEEWWEEQGRALFLRRGGV